jgi:hypothetical protein
MMNNKDMSTILETRDLVEVCKHLFADKTIPADLARRVDEEAAEIREEIRQRHGVVDVAVDLVREARTRE